MSQAGFAQGSTLGGSPKIVDVSQLGAPAELGEDRSMEGKLAMSSFHRCNDRDTYCNAQTSKTSELAFESRVSRYERACREPESPERPRTARDYNSIREEGGGKV